MTAKKTIKKEETEKVATPKAPKSTVKLISYTMKAVIPTGPYANIQPEITIQASSLQEAQDYIVPHLDGLYEKYLNISDRPKPRVTVTEHVPPVAKPVEVPKAVTPGVTILPGGKMPPNVEELQAQSQVQAPKQEVAQVTEEEMTPFKKAILAIESCKSIEALNIIEHRIQISDKLQDEMSKLALGEKVEAKRLELTK
jgi:hypothetical protein